MPVPRYRQGFLLLLAARRARECYIRLVLASAVYFMTNETALAKLPTLRPSQVVTLSLRHSKIQATFDRYMMSDCGVESSAGNISLIEYATSVHAACRRR